MAVRTHGTATAPAAVVAGHHHLPDMDQREVLWELFLCTCYGCRYALSRVAVFCNTWALRAGQHLIFYRDALKRLRIAVISNMPGKQLQELASCSDSMPCKRQLLLPKLAYPSSSEEPTDTAEAEDDEQPPSAAAQQASAASAALAAWHAAAMDADAAARQLQLVLQGVAAGMTALQPTALTADGCVEIRAASRSLDSAAVASILADKTNWQLLQRQALPPGSAGPWAAASAEAAAAAAAAPAGASGFSLSSTSCLSLECEELTHYSLRDSPGDGAAACRRSHFHLLASIDGEDLNHGSLEPDQQAGA